MFAQILKLKKKNGKLFEYLRIVRSVRKNGIPGHEVVANLGELSAVKQLLPNILKKLGIDSPEPQVEPEDAYIWGPVLVVREFFSRLGLDQAIRECVKEDHKSFASSQEVVDRIFALVAARLIEPTSEHGLARVFETSYIPRSDKTRFEPCWKDDGITQKNSVQRVKVQMKELVKWYRTLDVLIKHKSAIEKKIFDINRDLFTNSIDLVLYDITSSYFEGKGPATLAKHGFSKDGKPRNTQIVLGLLLMNGLPVAHHVFAGNTAEKKTIFEITDDLKTRFRIENVTFVFDSGMISKENLQKIETEGYNCIISLPRRHNASVKVALEKIATQASQWIKLDENAQVCEVALNDKKWRYFIVESKERGEYERGIREGCMSKGGALLKSLQERVTSGNLKDEQKINFYLGKLSTKYHIGRYYSWEVGKGKFNYFIDPEKEKFEKAIEGKYFIRTNNTKLATKEIANAYKGLYEIEHAFREIKDTCYIRPIYHHKDERVRAHVFVSVLSFLIEKAIQRELRASGILMNPAHVMDRLRQLKLIQFEVNKKEMFVPNKIDNGCSRILNALKIYKVSL